MQIWTVGTTQDLPVLKTTFLTLKSPVEFLFYFLMYLNGKQWLKIYFICNIISLAHTKLWLDPQHIMMMRMMVCVYNSRSQSLEENTGGSESTIALSPYIKSTVFKPMSIWYTLASLSSPTFILYMVCNSILPF